MKPQSSIRASQIRVVDLFAGPGGLSEGFAACHRYRPGDHHLASSPYSVALSMEKDTHAIRTLRLRQMRRLLEEEGLLEDYDAAVSGWSDHGDPDLALRDQYPALWRVAERHARHLTLGENKRARVLQLVDDSVGDAPWILLGGPPCQAYSLAGRSRNKGIKDYVPEDDERQTLYEEFLSVLADGEPPAFVFENVKGLLSASVADRQIFGAMLRDLKDPCHAFGRKQNRHGNRPRYRLYSLITGMEIRTGAAAQTDFLLEEPERVVSSSDPDSCVVRMEEYGVPQARHRVLILGLLDSAFGQVDPSSLQLTRSARSEACDVLNTLPALRSGLSRREDSPETWKTVVSGALGLPWYEQLSSNGEHKVAELIRKTVSGLRVPRSGRGSDIIPADSPGRQTGQATEAWNMVWENWFCREGFRAFANHEARGHMDSDLHRYLFASAYGEVTRQSPHLRDFPQGKFDEGLLPDHANVRRATEGAGYFGDRFRVQLAGEPSRTITSHISKDGHYYIHFDPKQCRSLTVREAARLQTFPDDYVFLGPRTEQYRQVGNAVPPYLSAQIALIVHDVFRRFRRDNG